MNIQGVIFVVSAVILEISFILIKKVDKKINILTFIGITIILNMCYNALLCYVLTFFGIPNKLYILAIINLLISIIFITKIINKKTKLESNSESKLKFKYNIQEYTINKVDVFAAIVILIITIFVTCLNFGFPLNIKYESGDPAVHYLTSVKFMQDEKLLTVSQDQVFGSFQTQKFLSYVNSGLIMKCFEGKINIIDNYIIFIVFGIFILYLTGYLLYFLLIRFAKNDKTKIIAMIVSILCILGYPLNSLLFGFEHMSISFTVILAIIEVIMMFSKENMKKSYTLIMLFLLNFSLFVSYYMFVPFVYPAEWIYFCIYSYKKDKKIFTRENAIFLTVTLILPFLLGYIYCLAPKIYQIFIQKSLSEDVLGKSKEILGKGFNTEGYAYINLYSNFILLLPLSLYVVIRKFKENKLLSLLFILNILFIIVLFIGNKLDKVSYYYLSKNYFTLWIFMFILNYRGMMYIYEKHKSIPIIILSTYSVILIIYLIFVPTKIGNKKINLNENPLTVMDIYGANKDIILNSDIDFFKEEIELFKYILNNFDLENDYIVLGDPEQIYWVYSFTQEIKENDITIEKKGQHKFNYAFITYPKTIRETKYIIYFKNTLGYKMFENEMFEDASIIYSNNMGGLVRKEK